jgi:multicomponent Na+:H+ antiporter subunit D
MALLLPILGAICIALAGQRPNLREGITLTTAVALFVLRRALLPVLAGERPELVLFEPCPACRSPSASSRWACSSR